MELLAIITGLALLQCFWFAFQVGKAHQRSGISAPTMTGSEDLERHVRVHMNTMESLMIFLPGLWMFGYYLNEPVAAVFGLIFIVGRFLYASAYINEPSKRGPGFILTALSYGVLLIGGMIGAIISLARVFV